jgi:acyl dehydratase
VINRESCLFFLDRNGFDQRIARDEQRAWASGFPNILVPSTLLMTELFSGVPVGASGVAEVWFHEPVPAGAVLTMGTEHSGDDICLFAALPAQPHAAVTGRLGR